MIWGMNHLRKKVARARSASRWPPAGTPSVYRSMISRAPTMVSTVIAPRTMKASVMTERAVCQARSLSPRSNRSTNTGTKTDERMPPKARS